MPKFSIEGAFGIVIGILLFILDKMGIGGKSVSFCLFLIALVLWLDSVIRSDWAVNSRKRKVRSGVLVFVIFLAFGGWVFLRPHKEETQGKSPQKIESPPSSVVERKVSPERLTSPATKNKPRKSQSNGQEPKPDALFRVSIEWARVSNGSKDYGTNFWALYPSEKGCSISSIQAAYFIRISNLRPTPVSVVGYGVSANGAPLKRILPQIGRIVGIPYKDGRMFGTTRDLVDALRPGIRIDFGQGPGFSWASLPIERSDFKKGVVLQLDLIDDLLKTPLQPNVPVRGWAFFQEPHDTPFPIGGQTRVTLETDDSQKYSYNFNLQNPNWKLDNLDRNITVKSFVDLSNCSRD